MTDYIVNVGFKVDSKPLQQVDKDLAKIKTSMDKATNNSNGTSKLATGFDKVGSAANAARGGVAGIGTELGAMARLGPAAISPITVGLLAAAAAALAVVTVFKTVVSTLNEIHQINEVAEVIGVATDKLTAFSAAMKYHGVAVEETQAILQRFSGNINKAVEESESLAKAFAAVGQSPRALEAMNDPVKAFIETARGLRDIEDINQRNALSFELFGKKAGQVLKEVADYDRALAIQQRLGNVATEERLALAARQDEAFKLLKATGESLKNTLVDMFGGSTTQLLEDFAKTMEVIALLFRSMIPLVKTWANVQMQMFGLIKTALAPVFAQYLALYNLLVKVGLLSNTIGGKNVRGGSNRPETGGPVAVEQTNKQIADASQKAADKAKAAAEAAAREYKSAYEAAKKFNQELEQTGVIQSVTNTILENNKTVSEANAKIFEAQAAAAKQYGVEVQGFVENNGKLGGTLQVNLDTMKYQTAEMKAQYLAAVELADANARAQLAAGIVASAQSKSNEIAKQNYVLQAQADALAGNRLITEQELAAVGSYALASYERANQLSLAKLLLSEGEYENYKKILETNEAINAALGIQIETQKKNQAEAAEWANQWKGAVSNTLGSAFDQAWETGRVGFKELLKDLVKQLAKAAFLKYLGQLLGTGSINIGTTTFAANGGGFSNGTQFFANGGVVNSPTAFGMANNKTGVMGEAGPEAIMPLTRGPNGKLGVQASGVSGNGGTTLIVSPGAVVVNSSGDNAADMAALSKSIDVLIDTKFTRMLKEQQRSGNSLNRNFGYAQ